MVMIVRDREAPGGKHHSSRCNHGEGNSCGRNADGSFSRPA